MLLGSVFGLGNLDCRRQAEEMSSLVEDPMAVVGLHKVVVVLGEWHMVAVAAEGFVGMARVCIEMGLE